MNAKVHRGDGAPVVRLRWVFTDQPFLPLGTNSVVNNRVWNEDYYSDLAVGQLPNEEADYRQDARWKLPAFKFNGHQCHPEWFATGEPWPVPSSLPPTVSLAGWIPECCVMACDFEDCAREPINGKPASQQRQYTVPVVDAVAGTPFRQHTVAEALDSAGGFWPGRRDEWFPLGTLAPAQFVTTDLTRPDGTTYNRAETINFDGGQSITTTRSVTGQTTTVVLGGVTAALQLTTFLGAGRLTGTNLTIDPAILPASVGFIGQETVTAGGTDQATATAITKSNVLVYGNALGGAVRLPAVVGAVVWMKQAPSVVEPITIYPPSGERLNGGGVDGPITFAPFIGSDLVMVAVRTDEIDAGLPGPNWTLKVIDTGGGSFAGLNTANTFTELQTIDRTTATTNAVQPALALQTSCTGTPAFGFGTSIDMSLHTSTNTMRPAAQIEARWFSAVDATRQAQVRLKVYDTVARTAVVLQTDGTAPMLGFFGVGATTRPTAGGSVAGFTNGVGVNVTADATFTGGGAGGAYTIDDIVFALKSLGLLT